MKEMDKKEKNTEQKKEESKEIKTKQDIGLKESLKRAPLNATSLISCVMR